jgi:hypothetical protein
MHIELQIATHNTHCHQQLVDGVVVDEVIVTNVPAGVVHCLVQLKGVASRLRLVAGHAQLAAHRG